MAEPAVVPEKTTCYVTATFRDKTGALAAPATVQYRLDCLTTGAALVALTSLSAGSSVEIPVTPTQNAIQNAANQRETKRLTVIAGYGSGDQVTGQYDYLVQNLSGVS
jgi:predicted membrane-bound mannosyltransferase